MKETIETQVCTKCRLEKPLSEYYFRKDTQKHRRDCQDCRSKYNKTYHKAYRKANLEKRRANNKAWREANPERWRASARAWVKNNLEKRRAADIAWRKANAEKHRASVRAWAKNNPEKRRSYVAKRRAAKLKATPAWADLREIQDFYEACPPGHHIDHIFPLISDKMCGLHVRSNLQYLPAKENIRKKNNVTLEQQLNG